MRLVLENSLLVGFRSVRCLDWDLLANNSPNASVTGVCVQYEFSSLHWKVEYWSIAQGRLELFESFLACLHPLKYLTTSCEFV